MFTSDNKLFIEYIRIARAQKMKNGQELIR